MGRGQEPVTRLGLSGWRVRIVELPGADHQVGLRVERRGRWWWFRVGPIWRVPSGSSHMAAVEQLRRIEADATLPKHERQWR